MWTFTFSFCLESSTIYLHLGHVPQHAKDDEARHEAGDAVDGAMGRPEVR